MDSLRNNRPRPNRRPGQQGQGPAQGQGQQGHGPGPNRHRRPGGRPPNFQQRPPQGYHDGLPNPDDFEAELAALDALDRPPGEPGERDGPGSNGPGPNGEQGYPPPRAPAPPPPALETVSGCLEIHQDGYGFLRDLKHIHGSAGGDVYVPGDLVRKFDLRPGLMIEGKARLVPGGGQPMYGNQNRGPQRGRQQMNRGGPPRASGPRLQELTAIEGAPPEDWKPPVHFDRLTPVDPKKWIRTETIAERMTTRVVDMFTPIGMGQRGLIVASPRSGKTVLIQHIADAISTNYPDVKLIVLLIDERPEEVTDMRRTVRGEVFASSNDHETSSHVRLAEMVIERAKRLTEAGQDVVVLLDSITRLARAYNKHTGSGRTGTGGLDIKALDIPKKLFGAARAFDEGGTLTVMATALVETGSRMDDVIFQEFKGTGNMELVLDRKLADRRVYPAINLAASGTRKEERLLPAEMLDRITLLRRSMLQLNDVDAMERLLKQLKKHETNAAFLATLSKFLA